MATPTQQGRVFDLAIRFGNQVRLKCAICKHFMRATEGPRALCSCGQGYVSLPDGRYRAEDRVA